ncbi:MAB_1171c family putative transporter [Actinoplanes sp. URMC 104]|uniref:MAB_1171c family putative transporter n=1 Tax=Actinoplanes sp. URMC 104 TaxID=3423409 RepID=UPI003F19D88B
MILSAALLVMLWGLAVARLPTIWRDATQRALTAAVVALAISRTAAFAVEHHWARAAVLQHLAALVAAYFLLRFLLLATGRGRRWHVASAGVVLALLVVAGGAVVLAPGLLDGPLTPGVAAYWVLLDCYVAVALMAGATVFWTIGAKLPARWSVAALRAIAAGAGLLALDASFRAVVTVLLGAGRTLDVAAMGPPAMVGQAAGGLLMVTGGAVTTYPRARAALAAYRSLVVLRPLWRAMRDAFPEVILFSPRRAIVELAGVDDVHLRLYRRVIEIRDGMLALRGYLDGTPDDPGPEGEARRIAEALRRRAEGAEPSGTTAGWAHVGPGMADEVAWLGRVSSAYRRLAKRPVSSPPAARTPRPSGSAR